MSMVPPSLTRGRTVWLTRRRHLGREVFVHGSTPRYLAENHAGDPPPRPVADHLL